MAQLRSFKDLAAWQKAMDLVESVYSLSRRFPSDERFGLTAQVRRAAISIPSNIAEGYARRGRADYVRFLDMARGSANEIETQLIAAARLGFLDNSAADGVMSLVGEVQRILMGLTKSLRGK